MILFKDDPNFPKEKEVRTVYEEKRMGLDGKIIITRKDIHYNKEAIGYNSALSELSSLPNTIANELMEGLKKIANKNKSITYEDKGHFCEAKKELQSVIYIAIYLVAKYDKKGD